MEWTAKGHSKDKEQDGGGFQKCSLLPLSYLSRPMLCVYIVNWKTKNYTVAKRAQ